MEAQIMKIPVIYIIVRGKAKGEIIDIIPTTIVASAKTVPRISPIANESSSFLIDFIEKNISGMVVPTPTIIIPIRIGLMFISRANADADDTVKAAPSKSKAMPNISMKNNLNAIIAINRHFIVYSVF